MNSPRTYGGTPLFGSEFLVRQYAPYNEDIDAIMKTLIYVICPVDVFFRCFCLPLENDKVLEIRKSLKINDLLKIWLELKSDPVRLTENLSKIELEPLSEDLCEQIRRELPEEEDIILMYGYSDWSTFQSNSGFILSN